MPTRSFVQPIPSLYDLGGQKELFNFVSGGDLIYSEILDTRDIGAIGATQFFAGVQPTQTWFLCWSVGIKEIIGTVNNFRVFNLYLWNYHGEPTGAPIYYAGIPFILPPITMSFYQGMFRLEGDAARLVLQNNCGATLRMTCRFWAKGW